MSIKFSNFGISKGLESVGKTIEPITTGTAQTLYTGIQKTAGMVQQVGGEVTEMLEKELEMVI